MNIKIEFIGFPIIYDLFPKGAHAFSLSGKTIPELFEELIAAYGQRLKESLLDMGTNKVDPTIQMQINGKFILTDEMQMYEIHEGDHVTFLKLLAGG